MEMGMCGDRNWEAKVKSISDYSYKRGRTSTSTSTATACPKKPRHPKSAEAAKVSTHTMSRSIGEATSAATAITSAGYKLMDREFFECDALQLAPKLLGKLLRKDDVILQITEVEAYRQNDTACHGRFGVTARTAPLFGPGGHSYVYLCYGLHVMLNVVADKEGVGAAILIRSCAPISGLETIQARRGQATNKPVLLSGPGKVGQALGLTTEWSNHPLYIFGGLEVLDAPAPEKILVGPRVGIEYASPNDIEALWRFAIAGSAWISAPRNTLRPA